MRKMACPDYYLEDFQFTVYDTERNGDLSCRLKSHEVLELGCCLSADFRLMPVRSCIAPTYI